MTGGIIEAFDQVAAAAEANASREDEYMGEDGLLRCRVCGGPRQTIVQLPFDGMPPRVVRCACACFERKEKQRRERERRDAADRHRRLCFRGTNMASWNFENDNRKQPELSDAARRYAEQFKEHRRDNKGLLYYGDVGTGKTYLAACIANYVIDQGYTARMTTFADVADELWDAEEKAAYIDELVNYDLLILDDLGAERKSEYMAELVFKVINARYRAGGPVIVTTNLTTDELSKTKDMEYKRIYDRLLERCLPIKVEGTSRRRQAAFKDWDDMRKKLGMEVTT